MSRRYQSGCLYRESRKAGPDVWVFRWRDGQTNRKEQIGTVEQFANRKAAMKACESLRTNINRETRSPRTMAELVSHYRTHELPQGKSFATREAYDCYLRNWIVPRWAEHSLSDVRTVAVEQWLSTLPLAPGSRAKIRNVFSSVFTHAMRHEWLHRNPIALVRQSAKRERIPDVLTGDEIRALLTELSEPYRTLVFLAFVTGLRVSELLALKWLDVDFGAGQIDVCRGIVRQHVGEMKTEASRKPLPLDSGLAAVLLQWRGLAPYNQDSDYLFASLEKRGSQPYWPENVLRRHIRLTLGVRELERASVFTLSDIRLLRSLRVSNKTPPLPNTMAGRDLREVLG